MSVQSDKSSLSAYTRKPFVFSSPECSFGELIGYAGLRRRPHSSSIFSSATTGPIKVKFHMEFLWDGGTKVCSNGHGHMTKVAAMHIYGKNLKKSSSPEPKRPLTLKLGMQHRVL